MDSLWMQRAPQIVGDPFPEGETFDELIAGAGITGLVTAVLFARAGRRVAVVEAREVGAAATGHTTAKVSQLQGTMLSRVRRRSSPAVVDAYLAGNRAAFDWLEGFTSEAGVAFERQAAFSYAATGAGRDAVEREYRLARSGGLPVELVEDVGLPFPTHGAVRLADQAQLDPMRLLEALVVELRSLGGVVVTGARVTGVRAGSPALVRTTAGEVAAEHVILATGAPVLDRGLYFAKLAAHRSYAQAWTVPPEQLPEGMFLGVESPTHSIRTAGELLLTGGFGHPVGRAASPRAHADALAAWTQRWWPGAERVSAWSAQDYLTPHGVPFVGWLPRGRGRIYLATGFSKWGMTNGVATALTLAADILGGSTSWQTTLHHRVTMPAAIAAGIGENAAVGVWYAAGWARALTTRLPTVASGQGAVGRVGMRPTARSEAGDLCAICPHLGAVVGWNDDEQSWDCPAHGSRFAADGSVLEGPAKHPLRRVSHRAAPAATSTTSPDEPMAAGIPGRSHGDGR